VVQLTERGTTELSRQAIPARRAGAPQALVLIAAMMLPVMSIGSLSPNLPQLMDRFAHVPNADYLVPLVLTTPGLCIALLSPLMGFLSDRWGRRPVLVSALLPYALCGLAPLLFTELAAILATRAGVGIAEAAVVSTANSLLGDYFDEEERRKWLSVQTMVGPILGSLLILLAGALGTLSWQAPFAMYALALPLFGAAWLAIWEPAKATRPATETGHRTRTPFPWGSVGVVYGVTLFSSIIFYVLPVQLGRIYSALGAGSPGRISIAIAIGSVGVILGGYLFRRIAGRPIPVQLAIIFLVYGVGLTGLGLMTDYRAAVPVVIFAQVGGGMLIPVLLAWALRSLSPEHRGRGMGLWTSCFFVGQFSSPLAVGIATSSRGGLLPGMIGIGIFCLAAAGVTWLVGRAKRIAPLPAPVRSET
jgi:MFS family permease